MALTFALFVLAICLLILFAVRERLIWMRSTEGIPQVAGCLPFIGHAVPFVTRSIGFIRECYRVYGPVFQIKFCGMNMVFIADRSVIGEFFKATEDQMSFYEILNRQGFMDAFFARPLPAVSTVAQLLRASVVGHFEDYAPIIMREGSSLIERMKKLDGEVVDVYECSFRFIIRTSARCFVGIDLDDASCTAIRAWLRLINTAVACTFIFPLWLVRLAFGPWFRSYRARFAQLLQPHIARYRDDPSLSESVMLRRCVDFRDDSGQGLRDDQIAQIVGVLFYGSAENTAQGLANALTDLARSEKRWQELVRATAGYVQQDQYRELLKDKQLDAYIMETVRTSTHLFTPQRKPVVDVSLGNGRYRLTPSVDAVALCAPILMQYEAAGDVYANAEVFDEKRFLQPRNESARAADIVTWGAGHHLCPGKAFAIYEIKMALALIANAFECFELKVAPECDYRGISGFAQHHSTGVRLKARPAGVKVVRRRTSELG